MTDAPEHPATEAAELDQPTPIDPTDPLALPPGEPPPFEATDADVDPEGDDGDDLVDEELAEDTADPEPARITFADLGLSEPIVRAVAEAGYVTPTPIQEQAIPVILMGRDVLGCAQTGTGKTAGFTLPMLDILASGRAKARMPRSLILEPTRELALQVAENFVKYGKHLKLVHALLIGGESMEEQTNALNSGVDVLIATPGRLIDLFERGRVLLADVRVLVIDEADRMLDMGFIPDVERIVSLIPRMRQTLFFSATMAPEIRRLSDAFLSNPREITVSLPATVATTITAGLVWVRDHDKREALRRLLRREEVLNALIFCNRKVEVDTLYKSLKKHDFSVGALHGDMDQPARFATLNKFKANELRLLVCSDVAARGLDIGGLSHVFNFDVPFHAEDYVHRIGRTGRAGREGAAFTIATLDDVRSVAAIEKLTGKPIPRLAIEGLDVIAAEELAEAATAKRPRGRGGRPASGRAAPAAGSRVGAASAPREGARPPEPRREQNGRSPQPRDAGPDGPPRGRDESRRDAGRDRGRDAAPRDSGRDAAPRDLSRDAPRDDRRDAPPRDDRRDAPPRDERRDAPPRDERRDAPPRDLSRDAPRDDRRDAPPRDDRRRPPGPPPGPITAAEAARRRERDDLGPSVRGFGDQVPAFMLIPIPRPRRDTTPEAEAEAA